MNRGLKSCICYIRYGEFGPTKEHTLSNLRYFIQQSGFELVQVYEDVSEDENRNAFDEMLDKIRDIRPNALVVWRTDRLDQVAQHPEKMLNFIATLSECHVRFICPVNRLDSQDSAGCFLPRLIQSCHRARRIIKGERVHASLKLARENNQSIGRPKIRDDQAIADLRKNGMSIRAIAKAVDLSIGTIQTSLRRHLDY